MKIYTKTGDKGETGLLGGVRVRKDDPRIEAYGTVDELNAVVGVARSAGTSSRVDPMLEQIQNDLFSVGAELATPTTTGTHFGRVDEAQVARLEDWIDACEAELAPLKSFILPGGAASAAQLHFARTVCRRAERLVVSLAAIATVSATLIIYLNRLSDLLFVLARFENANHNMSDVKWNG